MFISTFVNIENLIKITALHDIKNTADFQNIASKIPCRIFPAKNINNSCLPNEQYQRSPKTRIKKHREEEETVQKH